MGRGHRQERLGEEIKKIISGLILRELKDPRLSVMVSITAVEVTSDGSYATVYLSVLGNDLKNERAQQEGVVEALYGAKGLIRGEIGKKLKLRHTPDLIFKIDRSLEYGRHIDEIIDSLDIKREEEEE
ncbi:MAG TPA: 30S ribosome-binding factor RbfA [Candidatus Copromorpha excrementigallinarum]|uniref:Ribosome-binding factor A n=1 Tax=Candidatus Allocopromorpha excrementigallinarum TaxID=2840742 RepID=A0A9D1HZ76_9FIRM|nr:30S ribosome-binding factor RbfA [Candidatus Copromorpha excrementigallinarum]